MSTTQTAAPDPGFTKAQAQRQAAVAELLGYGVPVDRATALVHRIFSAGRDRGLCLAMRGSAPAATAAP